MPLGMVVSLPFWVGSIPRRIQSALFFMRFCRSSCSMPPRASRNLPAEFGCVGHRVHLLGRFSLLEPAQQVGSFLQALCGTARRGIILLTLRSRAGHILLSLAQSIESFLHAVISGCLAVRRAIRSLLAICAGAATLRLSALLAALLLPALLIGLLISLLIALLLLPVAE